VIMGLICCSVFAGRELCVADHSDFPEAGAPARNDSKKSPTREREPLLPRVGRLRKVGLHARFPAPEAVVRITAHTRRLIGLVTPHALANSGFAQTAVGQPDVTGCIPLPEYTVTSSLPTVNGSARQHEPLTCSAKGSSNTDKTVIGFDGPAEKDALEASHPAALADGHCRQTFANPK